jgi:D-aminopeptidase
VAGDVIPPARARELIRAGARRALERARRGELPVYRDQPGPHAVEVELRAPIEDALRENLAQLPEFEIADDRTIRTVAENMDLGFRRIAFLGYANRPNTTRY